MTMTKQKNRCMILGALFVNAFCCGGVYAWSVFSGSLAEYRNWDYGQVTLAYSLMSLMLSFFGIAGGKILDRFGPKKLMLAASVMWGGGWFLTGCVGQLWQLYLVFGIMAAVGSGLAYNPSITTAVRWYPDKKGFASGLITGATGLSSLVVAPVANMLLERYNVSVAFRIVGAAFLLLMFCASLLTDTPEPGWVPGGCEAGGKASNAGAANDLTWKEMFGDRRFYLIWLAFLGGCVSGLMLIGHASTIGKEVAGISSGEAALLVGIMAVANFLGRMLMGGLSDKIGRYQTILISLAASTVGMVVLSRAKGFFIFVTALILLCVCFGGVLSVFPNIVSENFGLKNMGINYGIVFTAYGIAALIGPMTASAVKDASGSYNMAFIIAGVFAAAAFILVYVIYCMSKKNKEIPGMD